MIGTLGDAYVDFAIDRARLVPFDWRSRRNRTERLEECIR